MGATYTFGAASVGTAAVALVPTGLIDPVIANTSATVVYVGPSGLTTLTGFPIFPGVPGVKVPWIGARALCALTTVEQASPQVRYVVELRSQYL